MTRIISGRAKGARLSVPKGARTRPTTDRVREALFSSIVTWFNSADADAAHHLAGLAVADLYSGSGAVALEAASRGAARVFAVEADTPTAHLIGQNADRLGLDVRVRAAKALAWAAGAEASALDLVFIDPPYDVPSSDIERLVATLVERDALVEDALVVVERSSRSAPISWPEGWANSWDRHYGETVLHFATPQGDV